MAGAGSDPVRPQLPLCQRQPNSALNFQARDRSQGQYPSVESPQPRQFSQAPEGLAENFAQDLYVRASHNALVRLLHSVEESRSWTKWNLFFIFRGAR